MRYQPRAGSMDKAACWQQGPLGSGSIQRFALSLSLWVICDEALPTLPSLPPILSPSIRIWNQIKYISRDKKQNNHRAQKHLGSDVTPHCPCVTSHRTHRLLSASVSRSVNGNSDVHCVVQSQQSSTWKISRAPLLWSR